MVALYDVRLIVRRAFVVVVSTAGGVTVLVGVTVVDGRVTVLGSKTDVIVCVLVSVSANINQHTIFLTKGRISVLTGDRCKRRCHSYSWGVLFE